MASRALIDEGRSCHRRPFHVPIHIFGPNFFFSRRFSAYGGDQDFSESFWKSGEGVRLPRERG